MTTTVSVGRFATMTHLSVKTLRHHHQVGLLEPAQVDPHTGYRYYELEQLPTAQLIRRLRDLRMPVADVRAVLVASSPSERDTLIAAHIDHLEAELASTQAAVHSLRALLECAPGQQHPVHRRAESSFPVLAITVPAKTTLGYVALIGSMALWPRFLEARFSGLLDQAVSLLHQGVVRGVLP